MDALDRALNMKPGYARDAAIMSAVAAVGRREKRQPIASPQTPAVWPPSHGVLADRWELLSIAHHEAGHAVVTSVIWPGSVTSADLGEAGGNSPRLGACWVVTPTTATQCEKLMSFLSGPLAEEDVRLSPLYGGGGDRYFAREREMPHAEKFMGRRIAYGEMEEAAERCRVILTQYGDAVTAVARELAETGHMTGDRLRAIIAANPPSF